MAPSPRLLFSPEINATAPNCLLTNCTVGVCFYDSCDPFPPFPAPPLVPDSDSVPISVRHKSRLLPHFLIAASAFLAFSFLSLLLLYYFVRIRRRRRLLQQNQNQHQHQAAPPAEDGNDAFFDEEGDGGPHHVWYIRTQGLDDAVIKSLAAFVYKAGDGLLDGSGDCSVCLGEFQDGDVVKLLPKCAHAFHLSCIDIWLRSHVNCPLCRAPVVAPPAATPVAPGTPSPEVNVTGGTPVSDSLHIETLQPSIAEESTIVIDLSAGSSSSSGPLNEAGDDATDLQPVRRSVSMDSSSLGMLMLRVEESELGDKTGGGKNEIELQKIMDCQNNGKGNDFPRKLEMDMKRSLSSRSGRLFFTRYARGRSASILPF